jgi:hypothetical protein
MWVPLGGACLKSSTFLQGRCARKKVTYEVPPAVTSTSYPYTAGCTVWRPRTTDAPPQPAVANDAGWRTTAGLASEGATDCGQESEIPVLPHHCAADLPELGGMPSRWPMWVPLGEACLRSSTFLNDESARKKVTYEVPPAVTSTTPSSSGLAGRDE